MNEWTAPQRPAAYAEHALVAAILDGAYPPGSPLPAERELAARLGITRPTLRETLQRLERDGWLTIQQGKPTIINNFWQEGGLNILGTLARHTQKLPPNFIDHLLETRLALAPAYTRAAVEYSPQDVASHLETFALLEDTPAAFACFDWKLHRTLALASGNPVYTLILNGFTKLYIQAAQLYFSNPEARAASRAFYAALLSDIRCKNASKAEKLSRTVMRESIDLWKQTAAQQAARNEVNHETLERLGR